MSSELTHIPRVAAFDLASGAEFAEACTHCGLCLESCPTYTLWGTEADSPRGRIVQIEDAIATNGSISAELGSHIDSCLGCMACVTACPEGVQFDELIARARVAVEEQRETPLGTRMQRRVRLGTRIISGRVREVAGVGAIPHYTAAVGDRRGRVGLLLGCTQRASFQPIHRAALAVLAAEGYDVIAPSLPECCGALDMDAGHVARAARHARATIAAFASVGGVDHLVSSAGVCGAAAKGYGALLGTPAARAFSALVLDVHEVLARESPRATRGALGLRVAYHESCQLRHRQGVVDAPRDLLRAIPGLSLIELRREAGACCGGIGTYSLRAPEAAAELGERQARAAIAAGAQVIVSADHNCIRQLTTHLERLGHPLPVHHPVELLARSLQAAQPGAQ